jgi:hypothetical protein
MGQRRKPAKPVPAAQPGASERSSFATIARMQMTTGGNGTVDTQSENEGVTPDVPEPATGTEQDQGETPIEPTAANAEDTDKQALSQMLKDARDDAIKWRSRFREMEAAQKDRDEAELTEAERREKRMQELEAELAERNEVTRRLALESAVAVRANALGIVDAEVAVAMLDRDAIDYDADGRPDSESLDNALRRLLKTKPYLKMQQSAGSPANPAKSEPIGETDAQRRARLFGGSSGIYDPDAARRMGGGVVNTD